MAPGYFCSPHPATASSMVTFRHATTITMEQARAKLGVEGLDKFLTAAMADLDAMLHFADDISPPTEQVQDYLTEVDTRRALFDDFRAFFQYHGTVSNATVFAAFMIAPISEIRNFLQIVRDSPLPASLVRGILGEAPNGIRACMLLFSYLAFLFNIN